MKRSVLLAIVTAAVAWTGLDSLTARGEDGYEAWLRYRPIENESLRDAHRAAATQIVTLGGSPVLESAADELHRGLSMMLDADVPLADAPSRAGAIVLVSTPRNTAEATGGVVDGEALHRVGPDGFIIRAAEVDGFPCTVIAGNTDRGVLYGAFDLLRRVQLREPIERLDIQRRPAIPLRMVNHWDNLDGTVERGYAGRSIFRWNELPTLRGRYTDYARLLASVGIGGVCINNVNAGRGDNLNILTPEYLEKVAALANAMRPWGVRMYLAVGFDAPRKLGGLGTADPLDQAVRAWWAAKADQIYARIPDFGGFVIKADSEGQPGPYAWGRDHADGANMLAEALRPHGGRLIWRAFVYSMAGGGQDRAAMAYDTFKPLDGRFDDNVLIQIKNGPIDFQVREPVHPLLGAMPATRVALELQITQEYTGHDVHVCFLIPSWKDVLDFDTHARGEGSTVRRDLDGTLFDRTGAIVGVVNVGEDRTWLGHHLHMANFYGFGRLAWDADITAEAIAEEWTRLTFGHDPRVVETVTSMLLASHEVYESYTSPLGVGVMHDAATHFDPAPHLRHYYHRADSQGVGFDRTQATGSGYTSQYHPPVAQRYESLQACPDELLLFFHHVPYTHRLDSGKTVIQHIYDTRFDGVRRAERLRQEWTTLQGRIDEERHRHVLAKLTRQIEHATHWRDRTNLFFFQLSGISDERRRLRSGYRLRHVGELQDEAPP